VGVALQTTLGKLESSVARHDLYISPVNYRHYHEGPAFTDEIDSFMNKRLGFAAENELRLLKFDNAQYQALTPQDASVPELDEYIFLDWPCVDTSDAIAVSPYADAAYEQSVRDAIERVDPTLAGRVQLSVLHERRYGAQF
jgi:hypothetical protein